MLESGTSVCSLRLANNASRKVNGEWVQKTNYFDITVWGTYGENVAKVVSKGSPIAVDGRIDYREWEGENGKRHAYEVVADYVEFLGSRNGNGASSGSEEPSAAEPVGAAAGSDDDIPF